MNSNFLRHKSICFFLLLLVLLTGCSILPRQVAKNSPTADKSRSDIQSQLSEKKWLLAGYTSGSLFVPLEIEHGSDAWILFNKNGTLNGFTGTNSFTGKWKIQQTKTPGLYDFSLILYNVTKKPAVNDIAQKFEQDILREYTSSKRLKIGRDSFLLLNEQNVTLIQCIYRDN